MDQTALQLGEPADEADWRALVERGLKGAGWERLTGKTADGIEIKPLYRESDIATATDGTSGPAAIFTRGAPLGGWLMRQRFEHPDPEQTNRDILADLQGGVAAIELKIDRGGETGVAITDAHGLDVALAGVILEAAPIALDAGEDGVWAAELLAAKLKGVAPPRTVFGVDPVGALMRTGVFDAADMARAAAFAQRVRRDMPSATALRVDSRPVHEAGGTEAQEIAAALSSGGAYLRALVEAGMSAGDAAVSMQFALSVGPDVLVETAKLRALRLCWERMLEASGVQAIARGARIHAFTSQRMMTRFDAHTNILRVTCAAFAAAAGGADAITTAPFTDALGLPTPFARRVARNTQLVLREEAHLHHVADPAGGAWFVEKLTRDLAVKAWALMQDMEAGGGVVAALQSGRLQNSIASARAAREAAFATRRETITGVTDFPLIGQKAPDFVQRRSSPSREGALAPIHWAAPFEDLRMRGEAIGARVYFANIGALAEFAPRAAFAQNLLGVGGVAAIEPDITHASAEALAAAFKASGARIAILCGADAGYAEHAADAARALKGARADWVALAGKPGENEAAWRSAGVDQFIFTGQNVLRELQTLHAALGIAP
ncbi:MAG: methylmalonyl-CoA mutase family protein [Hyphomonadaceae bacterium]